MWSRRSGELSESHSAAPIIRPRYTFTHTIHSIGPLIHLGFYGRKSFFIILDETCIHLPKALCSVFVRFVWGVTQFRVFKFNPFVARTVCCRVAKIKKSERQSKNAKVKSTFHFIGKSKLKFFMFF